MKRIITLVAVLAISLPTIFAQDHQDGNDGWRDRVRGARIAFITSDLQLTPEEAQVFWPVYNKYSEINMKAGETVRAAYKELAEAVKNNENVEAKLDAYTKALDEQTTHAAEAAKEYKKVLPVEKVAKLYLSEEKFRFQQIEKLHNGNGPQPQPQPAPQDGGRRQGKNPPAQPQPIQPKAE